MSDPDVPPGTEHFEPTDASLLAVIDFLPEGPFVMLNLFRLRDVPDFSAFPELEPDTPMSCRELFSRYIVHMDAHLVKVGAKRIYLADGGPCLVGPPGERWDVVQMVHYPSGQALLDLGLLVRDDVLQRAVMLADSRVVPLLEQSLDSVATR